MESNCSILFYEVVFTGILAMLLATTSSSSLLEAEVAVPVGKFVRHMAISVCNTIDMCDQESNFLV